VVKELRPPVLEDHVAREVRRLSAAQKKKEKDVAMKRQVRKALEREESPSKTASEEEEDDDSDDSGAKSCYDTVTFLAHLPDVRSL
jgi:hypothetical protein